MHSLHPKILCSRLILRDLETPELRHLAHQRMLRCAGTRSLAPGNSPQNGVRRRRDWFVMGVPPHPLRASERYTLQMPPPVV